MEIRLATAQEMLKLWEYESLVAVSPTARFFYDNIEAGNAEFWTVEDAGSLIGELYVFFDLEDKAFANGKDIAYLCAYRIKEGLRGRGLGSKLMSTVLSSLDERGITSVRIGVDYCETDNIRLYNKMGFTNKIKDSEVDPCMVDEHMKPVKCEPFLVLSKDEKIVIRKANSEDIAPACELALKVFMEYDSADYGAEHTGRMRAALEDRQVHPEYYLPGNRLMYVACHGKKIVGVIETYGTNRISLMFVDGKYQRRGIATSLMQTVANEIKNTGYDKIVLNASPKGTPFYKQYGFEVLESEKNPDTPWKTPMELIL